MQDQSFRALGISASVAAALERRGIVTPFPIQALVLPDALAGLDVLAKAPTGSGKTFAFGLPVVERATPATAPPPCSCSCRPANSPPRWPTSSG